MKIVLGFITVCLLITGIMYVVHRWWDTPHFRDGEEDWWE